METVHDLKNKIALAENELCRCKDLAVRNGKQKLQKKIESELRFLKKLNSKPDIVKKEHLRSSNLFHLSSIVSCCLVFKGVLEVLKPFIFYFDENTNGRLIIDVVADFGKTWIKVVARNPQALSQSSLGGGNFGRRTLIEQVEDLVKCASQNLYLFEIPKVKVWFSAGVTVYLKKVLEDMDVEVIADKIHEDLYVKNNEEEIENMPGAVCSELCFSDQKVTNKGSSHEMYTETKSLPLTSQVTSSANLISKHNFHDLVDHCTEDKISDCINPYTSYGGSSLYNSAIVPDDVPLNLDISTMLAYVSSLTNGNCQFVFEEDILTEQAKREKQCSVKTILDNLFKGHELICCLTACKGFEEIINTIGGQNERERAQELMSVVKVVPDHSSEKALNLQTSSKIRKRSQVIFGTGDYMKAVTVTANGGFLRAAESQNIKFAAFVHESRALTEAKERTAHY